MGRGSHSMGRGCILGGQGLLCSEIIKSAKFASSKISCDRPTYVGTQPLIESLGQRLKMFEIFFLDRKKQQTTCFVLFLRKKNCHFICQRQKE